MNTNPDTNTKTVNKVPDLYVVGSTHTVCTDLPTALKAAANELQSIYSCGKVGAPCVVQRLWGYQWRVTTIDCEGHLRYRTVYKQNIITARDVADDSVVLYNEYGFSDGEEE